MPVLPTSSRLFAPFTSRPLRVRAAVGVFEHADDQQSGVADIRRERATEEPAMASSPDAIDAFLQALDDVELEALERLDTESFEAVVDELQGRGLRRRHAGGFLNVVA